MKKSTLALVVMGIVASASVQAAEIYNKGVHSLRLSNRSIMRFLLPFTISKTVLPIRSGLSTT